MDEILNDEQPLAKQDQPQAHTIEDEVTKLHGQYQARLVAASLRAEAVKAGMIDLDGLKLIDTSSIVLDFDDTIVGGRKLMEDLRRDKPWLFGTTSSSSIAAVPASQPVRQKTALEMTDEEYAAARAALTRSHF
jgi:hypothetical protein